MITASVCLVICGILKSGIRRNLFPVLFIGQIFSAFVNTLFQIVPGLVSEMWFPREEVAMASSVCGGAELFGDALGSVLQSQIIIGPQQAYLNKTIPSDWANESHPESEMALHEVEIQITWLHAGLTGYSIIVLIVTIIGLPHKPKYAPSLTEENKRQSEDTSPNMMELFNDSIRSIRHLITNWNWVLLVISGGLICGVVKSLV